MKTIISMIAIVTIIILLNIALTKTELMECQKYVEQATTIANWWISQTDYEMCKHHGIDFSEYLK
jgi:hypothetical protein